MRITSKSLYKINLKTLKKKYYKGMTYIITTHTYTTYSSFLYTYNNFFRLLRNSLKK